MTTSARPPSTALNWFLFLALGFMWGSSYFWIKVAVETVPPFTLIAGRLFFGLLVVATTVALAREPLPRSGRQYVHLVVMACVNIAIPFTLITWGEQSIDSALASILNGTVPLFVIVLAPLFLPDESVTLNRIVGLAVGFAGVIVLFAPDLVNLGDGELTGELALLGSSVSYAIGGVYAKRNVRGLRPMIPALFQVLFAFVAVTLLALLVEQPIGRIAPTPEALFAIVWLGILGSGFAYLCYFRLLRDWGATRVSLVAYTLPVVGIVMGTFIGEAITPARIAGTVLIIAGVALVNSRYGQRPLFSRAAAPTSTPQP
ncbi:MAG TPA: EamA family transporter [Candidatus Limnocylindrales bacterium]|nr:EamA family transporter [Candidatus Limnocylindrales bacterium]